MTLIGATTENPYFEVNSALLSRCQIYELQRARAGARRGAARARARRPRARASPIRPTVADEALELLAERSGGDARTALGGARARGRDGPRARRRRSTSPRAEDALQRKAVALRQASGDRHYDYISALDQGDARLGPRRLPLLPGGDARGRRGPALHRPADGDPRLRGHRQRRPAGARRRDRGRRRRSTGSACRSARSTSPRRPTTWRWRRSRTPRRWRSRARPRHVREHGAKLPPDYLRDAHYPGAKKLGRGEGYDYPHDEPGGVSDQPLLPAGGRRASASTSRPTAASRPSCAERPRKPPRRRRGRLLKLICGRHR